MKKIIILFLLGGFTNQAFADACFTKRSNCWGFFSWRYKAYAKVKKCPVAPANYSATGSGTSASCNTDISETKFGTKPGSGTSGLAGFPQELAKATATAGPGLPEYAFSYIAVGETANFSVGGPSNTLFNFEHPYPYYSSDDEAGLYTGSYSEVKCGDIIFDKERGKISVLNLQGKLGVDDPDYANAFSTFKIFLIDYSNLELNPEGQVIASAQATIIEGKLVVVGGLSLSSFTPGSRNRTFTFDGVNIDFALPSNIAMNNVGIKVGTDVGNLSNGITDGYELPANAGGNARQASNLEKPGLASYATIDISANTSSMINFTIASGQNNQDLEHELVILDVNGNIIAKPWRGKLSAESMAIDLPAHNIATGNYIATLVCANGKKYSRKFSKP
jgi:hypothetical protein